MSRLIYLDHSTIVTLERAFKRDRQRFDQFVTRWREANCVLALSFVHVLEISGSKHEDSRSARIRVLESLGPTRTDLLPNESVPSVLRQITGREIFAVLGRIMRQEALLARTDRHWVGFPTAVPDGATGIMLRAALRRESRRFYANFREAAELEASALSTDIGIKRVQTRLRDLPSGPFSPDAAFQSREWFQNFLRGEEWKSFVTASFPAELQDEIVGFVSEWMENTFEEMLTAGAREVFAERVEADLPGALKQRTDELIAQHVFRQTVADVMHVILKIDDPALLASLADSVRLEDCPGTWLRFAVERELRSARPKWETGATYDLLHLSHLPYVDVMFTDGEIMDNTRKVTHRSGVPPGVVEAPAPVSVKASLHEVEQIIMDVN